LTPLGPVKGSLQLSVKAYLPIPESPQRKISQFILTPVILLGLSMTILGTGFFVTIYHWVNARTFLAIDKPISLAPVHSRTGPFLINLNDYYIVSIQEQEFNWFANSCPPDVYANGIAAKLILYSDGKVVDSWEINHAYSELVGFETKKGTSYDLDITVLSDSACFDANHPRLAIYTHQSAYTDVTNPCLFISALVAIAGVGLILLCILKSTYENYVYVLRLTDSATFGQYFPYAQTLPLREKFYGFPAFSMVGAIVLFTGWAVLAVIETPVTPKGIRVSLLKPGRDPIWTDEWTAPIILRIVDVGSGKEPELEINSKRLNWNELNQELKQEIGSRKPGAIVYIKADPNLPWADVAYALDAARGFQTKVVLLTSP
jgi:biopolymer transport protein ExbD